MAVVRGTSVLVGGAEECSLFFVILWSPCRPVKTLLLLWCFCHPCFLADIEGGLCGDTCILSGLQQDQGSSCPLPISEDTGGRGNTNLSMTKHECIHVHD